LVWNQLRSMRTRSGILTVQLRRAGLLSPCTRTVSVHRAGRVRSMPTGRKRGGRRFRRARCKPTGVPCGPQEWHQRSFRKNWQTHAANEESIRPTRLAFQWPKAISGRPLGPRGTLVALGTLFPRDERERRLVGRLSKPDAAARQPAGSTEAHRATFLPFPAKTPDAANPTNSTWTVTQRAQGVEEIGAMQFRQLHRMGLCGHRGKLAVPGKSDLEVSSAIR
jgi:hypothetical protein